MMRLLSKALVVASLLAFVCVSPALAQKLDDTKDGVEPQAVVMYNAKLPKTDLFTRSDSMYGSPGAQLTVFDEIVKTAANSCIVVRLSSETGTGDDGNGYYGQNWVVYVDGYQIMGPNWFIPGAPGYYDIFAGTYISCGYTSGYHTVRAYMSPLDSNDTGYLLYRTMEVAHK